MGPERRGSAAGFCVALVCTFWRVVSCVRLRQESVPRETWRQARASKYEFRRRQRDRQDSRLLDHRQRIPCLRATPTPEIHTSRQAIGVAGGVSLVHLLGVSKPQAAHQPRFFDFSLLSHVFTSLCVFTQNLKREGFRGLTNPYCQLSVGRQGPFTTDVVFDSTNPSWKHKRQTFEFRVSKPPRVRKLFKYDVAARSTCPSSP